MKAEGKKSDIGTSVRNVRPEKFFGAWPGFCLDIFLFPVEKLDSTEPQKFPGIKTQCHLESCLDIFLCLIGQETSLVQMGSITIGTWFALEFLQILHFWSFIDN